MSGRVSEWLSSLFSWIRPRQRAARLPIPIRLTVYRIDLTEVRTPQDLINVFAQEFEFPINTPDGWRILNQMLHFQERPYDGVLIWFEGWTAFSQRMPRWAKRLRQFLGYRRRGGEWQGNGRVLCEF